NNALRHGSLLLLPLHVARNAGNMLRPGGTVSFMGGTGGRWVARRLVLISALAAATPASRRIWRWNRHLCVSTSSRPSRPNVSIHHRMGIGTSPAESHRYLSPIVILPCF